MIRSTFYGFNIGLSGLMTAQKALDLTGNNFANINTMGYTRQRLDLNSIPSSNFHDRYAPANNVAIGGGVNVTKVAQLRDPFLDRRFRNEAAAIGQMDAHLSVMSEISRIFDEVQFEEGLYKALSDFMTQMQRYSTQTGEVTLDATVATAANSVLAMFQMYAVQIKNVRDYQMNLLNGHGGSVPEVNKMLQNIALLNKNIRECEIYGNPALELKDQRNLLLDQLSAYMQIEVSYYLDPDPNLKKMGIEVMRLEFITDNMTGLGINDRVLVDGVNFTQLKVGTAPDGNMYIYKETPLINSITKRANINITDPSSFASAVPLYYGLNPISAGNIDPSEFAGLSALGIDPDAFGNIYHDDGGTMRQLFIGPPGTHAFSVLLNDGTTAYLHYGPGTAANIAGIDSRNGMQIFNVPADPSDPEAGRAHTENIAFFTGALRGALDMLNSKGAFDDPPNTLNGIGYYEMVLDQIVKDFAETLNKANEALSPVWVSYWNDFFKNSGWDGVGSMDPMRFYDPTHPEGPFMNTASPPAAIVPVAPPALADQFEARPLFEPVDPALPISAKNIKIAEGWKNGTYTLTTSKVLLPGNTAGDTSNLEYMISLFEKSFNFTTQGIGSTDPTANALFSGNFMQMFKLVGLNAANDASATQKKLAANANVIMGIEDLRNSLSSVSMDEEGINLLRFQKSYAAAARVITTLDEALEVLINRTGIVGR